MTEMDDKTEEFVSRMNRIIGALFGPGVAGHTILPNGRRFKTPAKGNVYRRFEDKKTRTMYCWSVIADTQGDYWTWDYVPVGKGSRSGKAERWTMKRLTRASHRKTAKSRAYKRFLAAHKIAPTG